MQTTNATRVPLQASPTKPGLADFQHLPDDAFVDIKVVRGLLSCGTSTVWAWVRSARIPEPRKFGRSTRWNVGALRRHLAGNGQ